jgi:acyl carrier protein
MTAGPDHDELAAALVAMINAEVSLDPSEEVVADTDLLLTGLVDSLGVVQIVSWLEDRLGIEIDPSDVVLENFQTVDAMARYVERRGTEGVAA